MGPMCARVRFLPRTWLVLPVAAALLLSPQPSAAHARLQTASPPASSRLDRSPSEIKLSFTEAIEVRLSRITVRSGGQLQTPGISPVPGDPRSCIAAITPLKSGAYIVDWRVVSRDGHAMSGSYSFTIREPESQAAAAAPPVEATAPPPAASRREMMARWLFIAGAAVLLGAAIASASSLGGDGDLAIATVGCGLAAVGIALFADAQRRIAVTNLGALLRTSIGHALVWRAAPLAAAAAFLIAARKASVRRAAMTLVAACALAAIVAHAAAGHAGSVERYPLAAIGLQSVHFAAAGVWFGGLAALLAGTRGEPDARRTRAVQRYSSLAGAALAIVAATGLLRGAQEVPSWHELAATAYGQAALAKGVLLVAIAAFGALNRWQSVPMASTDLRPFRRFAVVELLLMTTALGVAAILATLAPPG